MRYSLLLICLSVLPAVVCCHSRSGDPARESTVYVDARSDWVNTRLWVSKGRTYVFRCMGFWAVAPENESTRWPDTGPEGHGNHPGEFVHRLGNTKKELPGVPFGTLLGKVGSFVFAVGARQKIVMPADGTLFLVINDYPFYRQDNRGGLQVHISKDR